MLIGIGCALWAALAMTFGDWFWAAFQVRHRPVYGLIHGLLLCAWIGLYLGLLAGHPLRGMAWSALVGLLAAASFYALVPLVGYSAMFASWVGLWFGLAWVAASLMGAAGVARVALLRGTVAAIGSGLAFYTVSDIWMNPPAAINYGWSFVVWAVAFLPGTLALLVASRSAAGAP